MVRLRLIKKKDAVAPLDIAMAPLDRIEERLLAALDSGEDGVIRAVDLALLQAAEHRASDVHFEPGEDTLTLRFRIDGALLTIARLPKKSQETLVSRLKVLARLIVYKKDLPQEGRIDAEALVCRRAVRVSTFPTIAGEKAVVRILDSEHSLIELDALGFGEPILVKLRELIARPHGTLLLTGPSASGKTTTIYALLREIAATRRPPAHIVTVEDPVEYRLEGIGQTEANPAAGLSFGAALRSLLRQDPDVIMVGEIRDVETAHAAVQAGLTGHLVISTIHSGTAAGVFARLLDMGVEPFLTASSVTAVLAQRLVRRNCPACLAEYEPEAGLLGWFGANAADGPFRRGVGCDACEGLGYHGRTPLGELLTVNEEFADCLLARPRTRTLHDVALKHAMSTLTQDGLEKAKAGLTTLEELRRVLPTP